MVGKNDKMEKTDYVLSICIPTYNGGDHLIKSVRDILNEGYKQIEVVVNDNCSTDDSIRKLNKIIDYRLKVFVNKKNEGPVQNMYLALSRGTGKYVMCLQDNDEIIVANLRKYISVLEDLDVLVIKNNSYWMRLADNSISSSKYIYYSVILNHFSFTMYLRNAFLSIEHNQDAFDLMKTCYPMEFWDIQILSQCNTQEKVGWINEKIPIVQVPVRKIGSRTGKVGNSSGYINYTYEWNVYYAKEWIRFLRKNIVQDEQFIQYALNGFYGKINVATYRYYDNMHDKSASERYGVPFIEYTKKEWLDFNWKFYRMFLAELSKVTKIRKKHKIMMKMITVLNRCCFNNDFFLTQKRTNIIYDINCILIIILKQLVEKGLEYGI